MIIFTFWKNNFGLSMETRSEESDIRATETPGIVRPSLL